MLIGTGRLLLKCGRGETLRQVRGSEGTWGGNSTAGWRGGMSEEGWGGEVQRRGEERRCSR